MVKTIDDLLSAVIEITGDDKSDAVIALMEDITDTINAASAAPEPDPDAIDWEAEAKRIDKEWRDKYTARFFTGSEEKEDESDDSSESIEEKEYKYEDLFEEESEEE